ncbi:MAG: glycosyltransferase [archaeon]|nr:glycosyltransferase [archaeon]
MEENNVILIPAHNEGNVKRYRYDRLGKLVDRKSHRFEYLRRTIQEIRKARFTGRIIVVNDGSTDNTAQIAIEEGAEVINLEKRTGKAQAIFYGLARVARSNPTSVLIMDADLEQPFSSNYKEDLGNLIRAANSATKEGRILQVIANVHELTKPWALTSESGIRCFSRSGLAELVKAKKDFVREFQLEEYLNRFFEHHTETIWTRLKFRPPWQTSTAVKYQGKKSASISAKAKIRPIPRHKK